MMEYIIESHFLDGNAALLQIVSKCRPMHNLIITSWLFKLFSQKDSKESVWIGVSEMLLPVSWLESHSFCHIHLEINWIIFMFYLYIKMKCDLCASSITNTTSITFVRIFQLRFPLLYEAVHGCVSPVNGSSSHKHSISVCPLLVLAQLLMYNLYTEFGNMLNIYTWKI